MEEKSGIPDAYGLEARNPGTREKLDSTFAHLASRITQNGGHGVWSDQLEGLASIIIWEVQMGAGNNRAQHVAAARKAIELLKVLPAHHIALKTKIFCWSWLILGWMDATDTLDEVQLADALLTIKTDLNEQGQLSEVLKSRLEKYTDVSRIYWLLNRANKDSNTEVLGLMLQAAVRSVRSTPGALVALANRVGEGEVQARAQE